MYAVVDVETTGLRTSWHDRVIELAVVHLDDRGRVQAEWCSLINPDRDLGRQDIHGISAAEARRAPTFAQVAPTVVELLRRRVLVAHNLPFDAMFLLAEFDRLGVAVPVQDGRGLCTMRLAGRYLPEAPRSLHACRLAAGLPPHRAHSALHDAQAAAQLLGYYFAAAGSPPPWSGQVTHAVAQAWPVLAPAAAAPVSRRSPNHREPHFLSRLVDRLPRLKEPRADAYLEVLDRALLDRHISATEADALVDAADRLGLARADVVPLHERYLAGLAAAAVDEGAVTADERRDLRHVARLLGLPVESVDPALAAGAPETGPDSGTDSGTDGGQPVATPGWRLLPGHTVVFTGAMEPERERWEAEAAGAGLRVEDAVTRRTDLLVAADPDTMSGKAKRARQYGIPIVHPAAYRRMLASLTADR